MCVCVCFFILVASACVLTMACVRVWLYVCLYCFVIWCLLLVVLVSCLFCMRLADFGCSCRCSSVWRLTCLVLVDATCLV